MIARQCLKLIFLSMFIGLFSVTVFAESAVYYYSSGIGYANKGDYDSAIEDYTEAISINPLYSDAYNARGICYIIKGDYDSAIADFTMVIDIDPQDAYAYLGMGRSYYKTGRYSEALAIIDKGLYLGTFRCEFYTIRANIYYITGNVDKAISDLQIAIRLFDETVLRYYNPYFNLGNIYYDKDDYKRAIGYYNDAIRVQPKGGDIYYARGLSYEGLDDEDRAQADFQMAKQLGYTGAK